MTESAFYRAEIVIDINDENAVSRVQQAESRINRVLDNMERRGKALNSLKIEPLISVRDQLTSSVMAAEKVVSKLGAQKASPIIEAQDKVTAVATRINDVINVLNGQSVEIEAGMQGALMNEIAGAIEAVEKLGNTTSEPVAELRGELFDQLTRASTEAKKLDRLTVEPQATLREQVTRKAKEIGNSLRQLTSKAWTVTIEAKDKTVNVVKRIGGALTSPLAAVGLVGGGVGLGALVKDFIMTAGRTETLNIAMKSVAKSTGTSMEELIKQREAVMDLGIAEQEATMVLTRFMQGELNVADAAKVARVAQDAAVIAGVNSSEATETIVEAISKLRPTLLTTFGMTKDLNDIFADYADQLGIVVETTDKYGKTLRHMTRDMTESEKKQAMLNYVLGEGEKIAGTYEGAMGSAYKKLGSLQRYWTDFKTKVGAPLFLGAFGSVIDGLTDTFKLGIAWAEKNQDVLAQWGKSAAGVFDRAMERVKRIIESPEFQNAKFSEKVQMLVSAALEDLISWLSGPGTEKLTDAFVALGEASAKAYIAGMKALGAKTVEELKEGNVKGAAIPAAAMYMLGGGAIAGGAWKLGKGLFKGGRKLLRGVPGRIPGTAGEIIQDAAKGITPATRQATGATTTARQAVKSASARTGASITAHIPPGYKPAGKEFSGRLQRYNELEKAFGVAPKSKLTAAIDAAKYTGQSIFRGIRDRASTFTRSVQRVIPTTPKVTDATKLGPLTRALPVVSKAVSKIALPLAVATEVYDIARSDNKAVAVAKSAAGVGGGIVGAKVGAAIGTAILPGIGTAIGGALGGIGGYFTGRWAGGKIVELPKPAEARTPAAETAEYWANCEAFGAAMAETNAILTSFNANVQTLATGVVARMNAWSDLIWENVAILTAYVVNLQNKATDIIARMGAWANETWGAIAVTTSFGANLQSQANNIITSGTELATALSDAASRVRAFSPPAIGEVPAPAYIAAHAAGGILTQPHLGLVAEEGPEAIIPLSPARRGRALELYMQTGRMLGVVPHAAGGIFGKIGGFIKDTWEKARTALSVIEVISAGDKKKVFAEELGSILGGVGAGFLTGAGIGALVGAGVLSPLTALIGGVVGAGLGMWGGVRLGEYFYERFPRHAAGGIITQPHIGVVAENGPEVVIPLSTGLRGRALNLLQRTSELLGVEQYAQGGFAGFETEIKPEEVRPAGYIPPVPVPAFAGAGEHGRASNVVNVQVGGVNVQFDGGELDYDLIAKEVGWTVVTELKKAMVNRG